MITAGPSIKKSLAVYFKASATGHPVSVLSGALLLISQGS